MDQNAFFSQALDIIREQNKELADIKALYATNNHILQGVLDAVKAQSTATGAIKEELDAHKKDAITWSKLGNSAVVIGKGVALVGGSLSIVLALMTILAKFSLI